MKFHRFFVFLLCNYIFLMCYTSKAQTTSGAAPPNIKLKIEFDEKNKCESSYTSKAEKCIRGELYKPISLKCSNDGGPWNSSLALHWYAAKDDNNVQGEYVPLKETGNSHVNVFDDGRIEFTQLSAQDINHYKCKAVLKTGSVEKETLTPLVEVTAEIIALPKLAPIVKDMTVVEGSTINVTCAVTGKATHVIWKFGDKVMSNGSESRVKTEEFRGVKDATLLIQHANATTDRGLYNCTAVSVYGNSLSQGSFVRIKSKYAALGPFLGICAEVIILCTIILIYEKKRDKTELEESDTDQGPETKSSPDHGQDSVRYRK